MLETFRKANNSWIVKILFGILVLAFGGAFGGYGISEVATMRLNAAPAIAVGHHDFSPEEVADEFRRDVEQIGGGKISVDQARQFGLMQRTIERIISRTLIDEAATGLGLDVDDDTLRHHIELIPAFQNDLHVFDRYNYQRTLADAHLSERQFVAMERADYVRQQWVQAIGDGVTAPRALADPLAAYRGEQRTVEMVRFPVEKMPVPAAPDETTLKAYRAAHADQFMAPEMRAITALSVRIDDLKGDIKPSDSDIAKAYEARAAEFQTAEKRSVRQIVFDQADLAQAFVARLGAGGDFSAAAKASGRPIVDLGPIERKDFPLAELADAVFAPAKPGVVGPVQSPLGWHVFEIGAIVPATSRPLADVRAMIVAGLAKDEATNRLYALSTKLEDAIGAGASIDEAAATVGVKPLVVPALDRQGLDGAGQAIPGLPRVAEFLTTVFDTTAGATSEVGSYRDGSGYFVVHVDKIIPAAAKPDDAVRHDLVAGWTRERQAEAARQQADLALARVKQKGDSLASVAGALPVETTKPFPRLPGKDSPIAATLATAAFHLAKPGDAVVVALTDGPALIRLKDIIPLDARQAPPLTALSEALSADILQEYVSALRKDLGVRVDLALIDKQFQK